MVEIIKRGQPKGERVHDITCRYCDSELRFREHEAKITHDQREGDFMTITCPVCKGSLTKVYHP
ncbi:hypothetical protein PARHAE_00709 [Paracoccus haematequi]|uniref:Uncharacterized protein n=1 Tax=Paracoccus haematequi TaxID=2491866 RepID=A0A3S4CH29_9RHOB|nr:hypothetical protein PARHAE_00709 [Paracoccus haematequi]